MDEKNTVGNTMESVLDDAVLAPEDTSEPISEVLNEQPVEQQQTSEPQQQPKEPGWMKGRIDAAVNKAIRESEARIRGEYEQRISRMQETLWDREAQDLVAAGEFKSLDRAKEYIRLKGGAAPATETNEPPRDEHGRFTKQQGDDPAVTARAQVLASQAQKIKEKRGVDVMQAFNDDPKIKQKVVSGEWDFYDVAEQLGSTSKHVPAPVRTPNGANTASFSFSNMSDDQWKRFNQRLEGGAIFDVRK